MDNFYFIPVNRLNLNNILSSESISPPSFYSKRGYGFKRFEYSVLSPFNNSVLAYGSIPVGSSYKTDRDEYDIFIKVPINYISVVKRYKVNGELIVQFDQTVYIDWVKCGILTTTKSQKTQLISNTKRSLESKHIDLYTDIMFTIENQFSVFDWTDFYLSSIKDIANINIEALESDKRYNKLKGFLYGYTCGKLKEKPSQLISSRNQISNFINQFSGVLNNLSTLSNEDRKSNYTNFQKKKTNISEELNYQVDNLAIQFRSENVESIDDQLRLAFQIDDDLANHLKTISHKKTKESVYSILVNYIKNNYHNYSSGNQFIDNLIAEAKTYIAYPTQQGFNKLANGFNFTQKILNENQNKLEEDEISNVDIKSFPFKLDPNQSEIKIELSILRNDDNQYLNIIINDLLNRIEVSTSDDIAQIRKDIIVSTAEKIKKSIKVQNSEDLDYLRQLHKSLGTVGVGFKLENSNKKSLQGLAYFLSRYSSIDKLKDYMDKNKFSNLAITYGMWGAAYGFANLSKLLLEPINVNSKSQGLLFDYLSGFREKSKNFKEKKTDKGISAGTTIELELKKRKNSKEENEKVFNRLITDNKKINKKKEWTVEIMKCYNEIINRKANNSSIFGNELLVSDFRSLISIASKNLSQFGRAKIDETTDVFSNYLSSLDER